MLLIKEKDNDLDEYFEQAIKECVIYDAVSASLLQRKLSIGYARAARLVDQLAYAGIVSAANGAEPRKVLILKNNKPPKKGVKLDTKGFLWANAQLIVNLLDAHGIKVKPIRITVQKENILFLFDFTVGTEINNILKLDKEIAAILASPTGKVEMGAPFKGTSLLYIYLPITKKMKEETYQVFDIDVRNIKRDPLFKYRVIVREVLLRIAGFLDELAYKI